MGNVAGKSCRENQNTHFMFENSRCLLDNVEKYCRAKQVADDNIIWRVGFALRITKATDTHLEYVIVIAFTREQ